MEITAWQPADLARLVEVSMAADELFAQHGMLLPPDDPTEQLSRARHVLVAGRPPVGFAATVVLDGWAHLGALAVHPDHGRQGIGGQLLAAACAQAVRDGFTAITLTTFAHLPWNAPWYAARGFTELSRAEWGPELVHQWAVEGAAGIQVAPRVMMIRQLAES